MACRVTLAFLVVATLAGCSPGATPDKATSTGPGADLAGTKWMWIATQTPVEVIQPLDPGQYTIDFKADGTAQVLAACNRGHGAYAVAEGRRLTVGPLAVTKMMCPPGTLSDEFVKEIENSAGYFFRGDTLCVDQKMDSGTMRLVKR